MKSATAPAKKPAIRIAVVESDPLRFVGFRALFDSESDFELVSASLPDLTALQNIDLVLLGNRSGQNLFDLMASLKATRPDLRIIVTGSGMDEETILKAIASGALECYVEDLREEFVRDFIFPTLRAGAVYNRKYLLGTSMARPLIARRQVEVARRVGADALAHGCTGKGNDQVRFELTYAAFAPDLPVIAPWREWHIRSREDAIAYAAERGIPLREFVTEAVKEKLAADANLPMCLTQGFSPVLTLAASLSLTASVTNSRRGIPRSAAADFA